MPADLMWNTTNVRNMKDMFRNAVSLLLLEDNWIMFGMFQNVTNMANMFRGATHFNRVIGNSIHQVLPI